MPVNDELGKRMKTYYEEIPKTKLMRRTPVIIRIDGKAFHTFTRGFKRPFDDVLIRSMQDTMQYLCKNIQGCVLGYHQSDEISLVLVDYANLNTAAWFDNEVQKMCSISASMATMAFNKSFWQNTSIEDDTFCFRDRRNEEITEYIDTLVKARKVGAVFDSRVFNIPREEVANYIYWRQLDATRNSIQMVGQANFSHKELQNKTCNEIQDMLMTQKGINWNSYAAYLKRGSCCIKEIYHDEVIDAVRSRWIVDKKIPIFRGEDRKYIERFI